MGGLSQRCAGLAVLALALGLVAVTEGAATAINNAQALNESKIIGGQRTEIEEVVWLVQVFSPSNDNSKPNLNGGTLISLYHVLTAGHPMEPFRNKYDKLLVTYGNTQQTFRENQRRVTNLHFHPQFKSRREKTSAFGFVADFDVAVLLLHAPIVNDIARIPKESPNGVRVGKKLRIAGWGRISVTSSTSTYLQSSVFTVLSRAECVKRMSPIPIRDHEFCVEETAKHAQCRGDSGGPAYNSQSEIQYGIVSWGNCGGNGASVLVDLSKKVIRDFVIKFTSK